MFGTNKKFGKMSQCQDVVLALDALDTEISDLEREVGAYKGPHFTKAYRRLEGLCSNLDLKLDTLDLCGREDLRNRRKAELARIDKLVNDLSSRVHQNGRSCLDCEIVIPIDTATSSSNSNPLTQAKENLLNKCEDMTEKIEAGQFKIKSDLAKDLVRKRISEAREFAEKENSTLVVIQRQMEALEKLCEKYDKK